MSFALNAELIKLRQGGEEEKRLTSALRMPFMKD